MRYRVIIKFECQVSQKTSKCHSILCVCAVCNVSNIQCIASMKIFGGVLFGGSSEKEEATMRCNTVIRIVMNVIDRRLLN